MDELIAHLMALLRASPPYSFVVGGGLGLHLKRQHLAQVNARTLSANLPSVRVTTDIDVFLSMHVFLQPERGQGLRDAIDGLGFRERTPKWQFEKPLRTGQPDPLVTLDLLSRSPTTSEAVRTAPPRVGTGSASRVHGRETPEAFAIDRMPVTVAVSLTGEVPELALVPHPFTWLNMKVRAAFDWLKDQEHGAMAGVPNPSAKHAYDVALILAMLTEPELEQCQQLAAEYAALPLAAAIRREAAELFGAPRSRGWLEAQRQGAALDHETITEALNRALKING